MLPLRFGALCLLFSLLWLFSFDGRWLEHGKATRSSITSCRAGSITSCRAGHMNKARSELEHLLGAQAIYKQMQLGAYWKEQQ